MSEEKWDNLFCPKCGKELSNKELEPYMASSMAGEFAWFGLKVDCEECEFKGKINPKNLRRKELKILLEINDEQINEILRENK